MAVFGYWSSPKENWDTNPLKSVPYLDWSFTFINSNTIYFSITPPFICFFFILLVACLKLFLISHRGVKVIWYHLKFYHIMCLFEYIDMATNILVIILSYVNQSTYGFCHGEHWVLCYHRVVHQCFNNFYCLNWVVLIFGFKIRVLLYSALHRLGKKLVYSMVYALINYDLRESIQYR